MSRSPFVVTLVVCGALLGWLYVSQDGERREDPRPSPAGVRALDRVYGFPDPRGVVLELRESGAGACEAAQFRSESPEFALWDDGTVVFRDSTFDYKRGRVPRAKAEGWMRTFRAYSLQGETVACGAEAKDSPVMDPVRLWGRVAGQGTVIDIVGLPSGSHAESCADCRPVRPLAWMLEDVSRQRYQGGAGEVMTGLPVEVRLEFRSCGCRNHPDIVKASREWPLPGRRPSEICGRGSARIRLHDPDQVRSLGEAISRSAAVLDGEEIYTCFMRPILDLERREAGPLARR